MRMQEMTIHNFWGTRTEIEKICLQYKEKGWQLHWLYHGKMIAYSHTEVTSESERKVWKTSWYHYEEIPVTETDHMY